MGPVLRPTSLLKSLFCKTGMVTGALALLSAGLLLTERVYAASSVVVQHVWVSVTLSGTLEPNTRDRLVDAADGPLKPTRSTPAALTAAGRQAQLIREYANRTDAELSALTATWSELPILERRVLLREVKLRMAKKSGRGKAPRIMTERRYGRVVRQSDGSVLRIEQRVVRIRSNANGGTPNRRVEPVFGIGFEQRAAQVRGSRSNPAGSISGGEQEVSRQKSPIQSPPVTAKSADSAQTPVVTSPVRGDPQFPQP